MNFKEASKLIIFISIFIIFVSVAVPAFADDLTTEQMQLIFDASFEIILQVFMVGFGLGMIVKLIKSASERW